MQELPTGTVTFLFTDIEGSTQLLQRLGEAYPSVLETHAQLIREVIDEHGGLEVSTEGDAFFCVFPGAPHAVAAAARIQHGLAAYRWPDDVVLRVRIGVHTGEGTLGGDNYVGLDVHRAARIASAGHGGQIVISDATRRLVEQALPEGITLRDLGAHRLKDLGEAEQLHQVVADGLDQEFPPLRTLDPVRHNLPTQLTTFLGRDAEVEEVRGALGRSRLVTLTGPGGTGKTRLALAAAAATGSDFPDGTWFVPLAAITDPSLLTTAILEELDLRYSAGDALVQIAQHFERRRALLVLDNFEQLLPAAASVAELLRSCAELHVLVTSRAPLHVSGEQELPIPPLAVPDRVDQVHAADTINAYPAVQLFVERALAARPDFNLDDDDARIVAEITARLDGLPLAIELAAALVKLFSPRSILERLERRLDVLTGGPQDLPQRQRSLRDAIAWSYELLDDRAQLLLEHMSVFAGGASLDALERVCAPEDPSALFDALRALVEQSLVVQSDDGGEPRFTMLGAIRDFARERLAARGQEDVVRRRHAEIFCELAQDADRGIRGRDEPRWAALVDREFDNLRDAATWGIETDDAPLVLAIADGLFRYAIFRLRDEVFRWATAGLELSSADEDPRYPSVLGIAGWGRVLRGDLRGAAELGARALDVVPDEDDPKRVYALNVLAEVHLFEGHLDDALRYNEEAVRVTEDPSERAYALLIECLAHAYGGAIDDALARIEDFRELAARLGAPSLVAWVRYTEGEAIMQREPERALALFDESIVLAESVGSRFIVGVARVSATSLRARHGDAREALASFAELLEQWRRSEAWMQLWTTLRSVAEAFARIDAYDTAAVLLAALTETERSAPAFGADAERLAQLATELEQHLDVEELDAARHRARALSDDDIVGFARDEVQRLLS